MANLEDDIINEYLKSTCDILLPTYVKLFNIILSTSVYPTNWNIGTIVPIFLKGRP